MEMYLYVSVSVVYYLMRSCTPADPHTAHIRNVVRPTRHPVTPTAAVTVMVNRLWWGHVLPQPYTDTLFAPPTPTPMPPPLLQSR